MPGSSSCVDGEPVGVVQLPLAGLHNARNACAAVAMGLLLGAPFEAARAALAKFGGVARRFEHRGEIDGITFIDDYAHLPTEVAAALAAARAGRWNRIVCVFQPHRYSRTATLWQDFGDAFIDADVLAITDVYAAGETPRPGISGKLVVQSVLDAHPWARVAYLPRRADITTFLRSELRPGDLCLTLGRRRPDLAARRAAGPVAPGARRVTDPLDLAGEMLGTRAGRDVPIGELTTYRVGGRAALLVRAETDDDLAAVAEAMRATSVPVLVIGNGSNLLIAEAGFAGIALILGERFAADRDRGRAPCAPAAAPACRWWPAARRRPGSPASSGRWACPARSAAGCA